MLLLAGLKDASATDLVTLRVEEVVLVKAGHAFLEVQPQSEIYAALWKDDMGHGSAMAGLKAFSQVEDLRCPGGCLAGLSLEGHQG